MSELKVTCLGQCGFLLDDGTTRIVTDPYLSDAVDRFHYSEQTPWQRLYPASATLSALQPHAVLISHAHTDHMDPITLGGYARSGGQAVICAPAPECRKLEELGIGSIRACRAEEAFTVGSVRITPVPCAHTRLHTDNEGRFFELSYIIDFGGHVVFFGGDMSLYDGLVTRLKRERFDLLLLPVNGRDEDRTNRGIIGNINEREAAQLAAALDVPYIPMHHDLYAINGCPTERAAAAADAAGAKILPMKPMETVTLKGEKTE